MERFWLYRTAIICVCIYVYMYICVYIILYEQSFSRSDSNGSYWVYQYILNILFWWISCHVHSWFGICDLNMARSYRVSGMASGLVLVGVNMNKINFIRVNLSFKFFYFVYKWNQQGGLNLRWKVVANGGGGGGGGGEESLEVRIMAWLYIHMYVLTYGRNIV